MRTTSWRMLLAILVPLSACRPSSSELSSADIDAIKRTYTDWAAATASKDWEAAGNLGTADVWLSDPHQAPIEGRGALVTWLETNWPANMSQTWVVQEVAGYRDLAYARATATEVYTRPDGTQYTEHSLCLNTFRREPDGAWRFSRNSCHLVDPLPAPPAGTP